MSFDRKSLIIPDGTRFEEHTIVCQGDVILGNHVKSEFGLLTDGRIFAGESAKIGGHVNAKGDIRTDNFCLVDGDVDVGGNAFLGEKSRIEGKLTVAGDLDVGDDVAITKGFEAKGWINIRSPVPLVIYIFLYMLELMRLGKGEEVERILGDLEAAKETIQVADVFLYVPDRSSIGLTASTVRGNLFIGRDCRVLGNYTVHGNVSVGPGAKVYGALKASGTVKLQATSLVEGAVEAGVKVHIGEEVKVMGTVKAPRVELFHSAVVDGQIVAPEGIQFTTKKSLEMEEKVERFAAGMRDDVVDLLG
jgi:predicted acyltransferase (DUF342 family)